MKVMRYDGPKKVRVETVDDMPLQGNQVRIQTMFSGISHGTEMNVYRGAAPFFNKKNDGEYRLFSAANENEKWIYPVRSCDPGVWYMGYSNVGKVIEVGKDVHMLLIGDVVYSSSPHQSQVIVDENNAIRLPEGIKPEHGIFFTNLMTTFNGILDTKIKLGDTVAVSGLGVLGQLLIQMTKMSGAFQVFGIDLFEKRLITAKENGADKVFNPKRCEDIALEIRKLTNKKGTDAVIEVTGNQAALQEAIRIAAPDTTVTALGWYQGACKSLNLSEEFHHNRVTIRSSQTCYIQPEISHMWTFERKQQTCLALLKKLQMDNLITHRIPFDNIADAYHLIDENTEEVIQAMITY